MNILSGIGGKSHIIAEYHDILIPVFCYPALKTREDGYERSAELRIGLFS